MKTRISRAILLLIAHQTFANGDAVLAEQMANAAPAVVIQAVENLWATNTPTYFQAAADIATNWQTPTNAAIRTALFELLDHVTQKTGPTNVQASVDYFRSKEMAVNKLLGSRTVYQSKEGWLSLARFIGEVRMSRITDYQPRYPARPGLLILEKAGVESPDALNDTDRLAYDNDVVAYTATKAANELQSKLRKIDGSLMWSLSRQCERMRTNDAGYTNFVNQLAETARLTEAERQKLLGAPSP